MHFSNFISSFLTVGLIAVPALGLSQYGTLDNKAVEKRWDSVGSAAGASLAILQDRAVARAPAKATKGKPKLKGSPAKAKECNAKLEKHAKVSGVMKTPKRAVTGVNAGAMVSGVLADTLFTNSLITCIGIIAISNNGRKVMAHINGENTAGESYTVQATNFKNAAAALGGTVKVYVSYPDVDEGGEALADTLGNMIGDVDKIAEALDSGRKYVERKPKFTTAAGIPGGEMETPSGGRVYIDDCLYSD